MPPYSSITSAMWMRVACIRTSRSSAGIEGGTKSTGRRILAVDERHRQVDLAEARRRLAGPRVRLLGVPAVGPRGDEVEEVPDVDHAPRVVERLADRPAGANGRRCGTGSSSSPSVVSSGTATMSARGTITSSTRMPRKPSTFLSIARSCGREVRSSPVSASASSRSSRIDSRDFRPSRVRRRSYQRARAPRCPERSRDGRSLRLRSSFMAVGSVDARRHAAISR